MTRNNDDRPYGDPQRAANIRWESRSRRWMRRGREALMTVAKGVAWPIKKTGTLLMRLGGGITGAGYTVFNKGRDVAHWERED